MHLNLKKKLFRGRLHLYRIHLLWKNFTDVQDRIDILRYILNSVIYAGGTTALAVVVNCMAGYAYAFYDFKGKTGMFLMTLATMMVPFQVIMVPLFLCCI